MRFLITGGAGFIGSRVTRRLAQSTSNQIWVLDNLHPQVHGVDASVPDFPDSVVFLKGDVCDRATVEKLVIDAQPNVVIHMAAETGTGQSMDEIYRYCDVNVSGTAILLEALKLAQPSRFILMSSRALYGEGAYWSEQEDTLVVPPPRTKVDMEAGRFIPILPEAGVLEPVSTPETIAPSPSSVYASTKLMQEYLVQQAGAATDWSATFLRFQNVYGPGQSLKNPYTGVLSIFSSQILAGQRLNIYEDGQIVRDFVFVDDVVRAIIKACECSVPHGTVINIGSGQPTSILEAAQMLLQLYGKSVDAYEITGDFRMGDIRYAVADIQKARELLDWQPQMMPEEGLKHLSQWCLETINS
ncbi:MAG: NAD-dependent epimerase/dehydratase family protein [Leptolyngbya sp. SIO3F4]|nr:NAD-dependent epimerase/dehydratase family protein [Leptolyngbya sp. SIO3F4]